MLSRCVGASRSPASLDTYSLFGLASGRASVGAAICDGTVRAVFVQVALAGVLLVGATVEEPPPAAATAPPPPLSPVASPSRRSAPARSWPPSSDRGLRWRRWPVGDGVGFGSAAEALTALSAAAFRRALSASLTRQRAPPPPPPPWPRDRPPPSQQVTSQARPPLLVLVAPVASSLLCPPRSAGSSSFFCATQTARLLGGLLVSVAEACRLVWLERRAQRPRAPRPGALEPPGRLACRRRRRGRRARGGRLQAASSNASSVEDGTAVPASG